MRQGAKISERRRFGEVIREKDVEWGQEIDEGDPLHIDLRLDTEIPFYDDMAWVGERCDVDAGRGEIASGVIFKESHAQKVHILPETADLFFKTAVEIDIDAVDRLFRRFLRSD